MSRKPEKEKNQNIQVFVRCRPLNASEKKKGAYSVVETGEKEVNVKERSLPTAPIKTFNFDRVYGAHSKQIEVYRNVVSPLIEEVLLGYNCTVFAYGQTGTGKTFTMEGERTENASMSWEADPLSGIIPRAMNQLFTRLSKMGCEFSVRVSFLEIYNEDLIDLLGAESVDNPRLKIYEDSARKGSCVIQGLEEVVVQDKDEVYKIMDRGSARRQTAATLMNAHSSRSHSLFMVTIHIKENSVDGEELLKTGKLNLVDLAGSECIGRSGAVDKRAREAGNINQSLLTLGRVITALVEHTPHIPYRESKLTRLLQDSLGGRTKTSIIATISPASINLDETLSTLDYAFRAKNIMNRPEVNQKLTKKALLKEYNEEIERLRRDLQAARDKNGVYLAQENYDDMQIKIQQQRDTINDLTDRVNATISEMIKITDLFTETKEELADTRRFLEETKRDLSDTRTTLEKTRLNLQMTIQDRDEQKHIVSQQVVTESELSKQANQLLDTADTATNDVAGLHSKLDRKREVELHNENAQDMFMTRFTNNINGMKNSLAQMTEQQSNSSMAVVDALNDLTERRTTEVETVCSDLGSLITIMKKRLTTLEEEEGAHLSNSKEWSDQVASYCSRTQEEELSRSGDFHERTFLASMTEVHTALRQHHESLNQMKQLVSQQVSELQANIGQYKTDMVERLTVLDDLASSFSSDIGATLTQQKEDMQMTKEAHEVLNKELAEKLVTDVNKLVEEMVGKQQSLLTERVRELQSKNSEMSQRVTTFSQSTAAAITEGKTRNEERSGELVTQTTAHNATLKTDINKMQQNVDDVSASQDKLRDDVSAFYTDTVNVYKSRTNRLLELKEEHMQALNIARSAHTQSVETMTEEMEKEMERLREQQKQQHASSASVITEQSASLRAASADLSQSTKTNTTTLGEWDEEVARFVSEEIRRDKPTGQTPQRREFVYPSKLTRTDRHSLLLQNFRRDYILQDVTDLPIPDTSFESHLGDVSPLTFDEADVVGDDSVQNVSSDSAFSSNSVVSGVTSADLADLDEVSKRGRSHDNKENQMKPPETKGAPKSKQREQRSRSRSGTRTPVKTPSGSTTPRKNTKTMSTNTSSSNSSQGRARTRLPLRSNNP